MKHSLGRQPRSPRIRSRNWPLALALVFPALVAASEKADLPVGRQEERGAREKDNGSSAGARLESRAVVEANYRPLNGRQRMEVYLRQTYVPGGSYFGPLFSSISDQAKGEPGEWGGGMQGYSRRLGSRVGEVVIRGTIRSGVAALLKEDPRLILKREGSVSGRVWHGAAFTFLTLDDKGRRRVSVSTIGGYFAASFITQAAWQPDRLGPKDAVREVGRRFLGSFVIRQAQEFWPEIRRHVLRRR